MEPFETSHQASSAPEAQAVYAAFDRNPGPAKMRPHNYAMLVNACRESGVRLGTYDRDVLEWLASWEPAICAAVARMIRRASEAGKVRHQPEARLPVFADEADTPVMPEEMRSDCPPWCTINDRDHDWHMGTIGIQQFDPPARSLLWVQAAVLKEGEPKLRLPSPAVIVNAYHLAEPQHSAWLSVSNAAELAEVETILGHDEFAGLLRKAVKAIAGGEAGDE